MVNILAGAPLLLLFVVAALGYLLGKIELGGGSLGVAGVLFAGLAVGAIDPRLRLPDFVYQLGLVLFVYTIGLSSGPGFLSSLRGRGLRYNMLAVGVILGAAAVALLAHFVIGLTPAQAAGVFTGSLTNTPALAGVVEYLKLSGVGDAALTEPVVSYSLAYPVSVLGMILAIYIMRRVWRKTEPSASVTTHAITHAGSATNGHDPEGAPLPVMASRTILVGTGYPAGPRIRELMTRQRWDVVFSRVRRNGNIDMIGEGTVLQTGDLVTAVGSPSELDRVTNYLGEASHEHLEMDRRELDFRRVFVSNPHVVGRRLRELDLPGRFGAVITRVRRGDIEMVPHGDTVLEPGDAVRVLASNENLPAVSAFFGDSYRAVSEIDILSFSLGVASGVLLGMLPIPLPGGITITLGLAGGPLIVALLLGALGRTGPVVWTLPFGANLMLRQLGLIFFLAGIGTRSGYDFFSTLASGRGYTVLLVGVAIVALAAVATLWIGHRILHIPVGILSGLLAAIQTQPATLAFALQQSGDDSPNEGYALIYPMAVIAKIVVAQLILVLLL
ncbi:MAG: aspartate:alanine exchanger family transporter [Chloroflexota bacterium]